MSSTKASSVRSKLLLRSENLSRLTLWWVTSDLVIESDFYTKHKKLDVQEGKKDNFFADHVTQVCKAHNQVIVSFLQQVQGGTRPTTEGARQNIGHNMHV